MMTAPASVMSRDNFVVIYAHDAKISGNLSAAKRLLPVIRLELCVDTGDLRHINNLNEGKITCSKLPGSSPLSQHSACPHVQAPASVTPIWSVALSAPAQVWSPLKSSTPIRLQRQLPVWPLACSATTQVSAAAHAKTRCASARHTTIDRRRGSTSAAILRLKD